MRIFVLAALCLAALATPAVADARTWQGKTKQGRAVTVKTGADDLVNRVRVSWRAPCEKGHYVSRTLFLPPLDVAEAATFEDAGTYESKVPGGYKARHTVFVRGALDEDSWAGTFRVRTRVIRDGKEVDRCKLERVRWTAEPVE